MSKYLEIRHGGTGIEENWIHGKHQVSLFQIFTKNFNKTEPKVLSETFSLKMPKYHCVLYSQVIICFLILLCTEAI